MGRTSNKTTNGYLKFTTIKVETMNTQITTSDELMDFINAHSQIIVTQSGRKYYYIPRWFREISPNQLAVYSFQNLPGELTEAIEEDRNPKF